MPMAVSIVWPRMKESKWKRLQCEQSKNQFFFLLQNNNAIWNKKECVYLIQIIKLGLIRNDVGHQQKLFGQILTVWMFGAAIPYGISIDYYFVNVTMNCLFFFCKWFQENIMETDIIYGKWKKKRQLTFTQITSSFSARWKCEQKTKTYFFALT